MEPEWNVPEDMSDAIMLGLNIDKKPSSYLEDKIKIKNLISDVGYKHLLEYIIEDLDAHEILTNDDLWILRMAESIEDAYQVFVNKENDESKYDIRIISDEN